MNLADELFCDPNAVARLPLLSGPILNWYDQNARVLPWRELPTPYRVWVSEIMLQQTRVETVKPYFERFMAALPDIPALARAPQDTLLKLWEGLGYYSRVRNLQKAALVLTRQYGGKLPADYDSLLKLPGIGVYTAGAIASIAFGLPVPAVDGNVLRVLSRLTASRADIACPQAKRAFRAAAASMLPGDRAGAFNQAMMELGATVCLPNTLPRCAYCPAADHCSGFARGIAAQLPVKSKAKPRRIEKRTVLVIIADKKVLLHRRPPKGLLGGMWELPNAEGWLPPEHVKRAVANLGADPLSIDKLEAGKHIFSHIEWHMQGYRIETAPFLPPSDFILADTQKLQKELALPGAFKTYSRHLPEWLCG